MPDVIRVLIVDDHPVVRKGICFLLQGEKDIEVAGEASNGLEAILQVEQHHPDVVLMDLIMPDMDGIEATRRISSQFPQVRILVLTSFVADDKVFPAIKAGAQGYLLKDTDPEFLVQAIHQVYREELSLSPVIARKVLQELKNPAQKPLTPEPLTEREVEILQLISKGMDNHDIAAYLDLSDATVRSHVSNILSKLHLANRVQATLFALRSGLASLNGSSDHEGTLS
jgi:NarL family two-component system response regulator LiaR